MSVPSTALSAQRLLAVPPSVTHSVVQSLRLWNGVVSSFVPKPLTQSDRHVKDVHTLLLYFKTRPGSGRFLHYL